LKFIHNLGITGIQWDGVLVGAGSLWPPNNKGKMKYLHVPVA
jgi:hypothetical protein